MSGGMQEHDIESAKLNLQIARNHSTRIDGLWYRSQPWGLVSDHFLAPVFRAFARKRRIDDTVEFLYDVNNEPSVMVHQPMNVDRRAYYYRMYLKEAPVFTEVDDGTHTLNLLPSMFAEAKALFGPFENKLNRPRSVDLQQSEFLIRTASSANDYLVFDGHVTAFWESPEFGTHHAAVLAKHGLRRGATAVKGAPEGRKLVQNRARPVVRFGNKG